jgi:hypothetical protein
MMTGTAEIAVSLATFKVIEAARLSFGESHDEIIRRIFARGTSRNAQPMREGARYAPPLKRRRGDVRIELFGREQPVPNLKYGYIAALQSLVRHKPALFELLSLEGTSRRRWAARTTDALFPGSPHLARDHAHEVMAGWFIDTNLSRAQIETRLSLACKIAGYKFGEDVRILGA